jgi:hypothetical protein
MERKAGTKKLPKRISVQNFVHEFFSKEFEKKRERNQEKRIVKFA